MKTMKKTEFVLYGVHIGEPNYMEQLIFVNDTPIDTTNEKLIEWARRSGFDRLRTSEIDLSQSPNFMNTL